MSSSGRRAVRAEARVVGLKRVGEYLHLTLVAAGVADRFRPGSLLAVAVGGPTSAMLARRTFPVHRARATGAYGDTVEVVFSPSGRGERWLAGVEAGTRLDVVGPLGRPFALPQQAVPCLLVGEGVAAAALFSLADRLRERGCTVHMLLGAASGALLFGALEARRAARSVVVVTEDGSVGIRGGVADTLPGLLTRTAADVVYAAGPVPTLRAVAHAAEEHGAWSQTAVPAPMPCGTGLCLGCVLPVVGEDGRTRMVRACLDGPVFRGDRVRWDELEAVPVDAVGALGGTHR